MYSSAFDLQLENIQSLKWLPWVGNNFQDSKFRVMVYGESLYLWENDKENPAKILNGKEYHRVIFKDKVLKHKGENGYNVPLYRNIEKAIFQKHVDDIRKDKLWDNLSYNVIVQHPVESIKHRPTYKDYGDGWKTFFEVQKILKPAYCIFLGVEASIALRNAIQDTEVKLIYYSNKYSKIGTTVPRIAVIKQGELETKLIFIRHTSAYFSWKKWGAFIKEEIPDILSDIV